MGQKIHPGGLRLGYIKDWESKWFNLRQMPELLEEDRRIRTYLRRKLAGASVSRIGIERAGKQARAHPSDHTGHRNGRRHLIDLRGAHEALFAHRSAVLGRDRHARYRSTSAMRALYQFIAIEVTRLIER